MATSPASSTAPRLGSLTFDQLLVRVRRLPGLPVDAAGPLAAAVYRHLPWPRALQRAWDDAAAALARLRAALARTDDVHAPPFIDRFFRRFYRASGPPFGPAADRRPDRARLLAVASAVLHHTGATPAETTRLLARLLTPLLDDPLPRWRPAARLRPADVRALEEILLSPEDRRLPIPARTRA